MGVFSTNLAEIGSGGLVSSSHTSDLYNVLLGNTVEDTVLSGSFSVTGSASFQTVAITSITGSGIYATSFGAATANIVSGSFGHISGNTTIVGTGSLGYLNPVPVISGSTVAGTSASLAHVTVSADMIMNGTIFMYTGSLPTTDPQIVNQLWRSGRALMISTGSV